MAPRTTRDQHVGEAVTPERLAEVLGASFCTLRPDIASERALQNDIAGRFRMMLDPTTFAREHQLTPRDRPDFFVGFVRGVAVEVKVKGTLASATRQLFRYAEHPTVTGVLLVTTLNRLAVMPDTACGKPLAVLCLGDFLL